MRPIALLPLLLACAACSDTGQPGIVGQYVRQPLSARDDPSWRGVVGEWQQEYRSDGHLIVHGAGMDIDSLYRLDGDILTLDDIAGSGACRAQGIDAGSARYRVHFDGDSVRFDALHDECVGRRSVMTTHQLRRVR